ncbi:MAG: sigma-54-dependent Fis family transcriptional regulator [Gammaproteobacteria bacterium]|nr:MAG: sigma-54-dependent Fis family transcriptional regulator [Gammaproteobacteria bacterium]
MKNPLALIVDDEPDILELLEMTLSRMEIDCQKALNLKEATTLLSQFRFDLCLTDMRLPDGDGLDLVEKIQKTHPELPVAVITAHGSMEIAVEALKKGAFDFVSKPVDLKLLRNLVESALKLSIPLPGKERRSRDQLLGESPPMREIRSKIVKLSRSQAPIYISGESGTGKELVARLLHQKGPRSDKPFIAVNCGAIPGELMESEFFGHKKGSFSGAVADKDGFFQAAEGGTLFLDEIGELPLPLQVKLLRAIQEKTVRPVGGQHEIPVDTRILSATHKNLNKMVTEGTFRQDLYYRVNVIELKVPPLRERHGDLAQLVDHILRKLAQQMQLTLPELSDAAQQTLHNHHFPGNIRELENLLERAITLCENNLIEPEDLNISAPLATPSAPLEKPIEAETAQQEAPTPAGFENYMEEVEKKAIVEALEKTRWNKTAAAKQLGITFRALRYRLKKFGIE